MSEKGELIEQVGKLGIGLIALLGLMVFMWILLDRLLPILERQTQALEQITRSYTGKQ